MVNSLDKDALQWDNFRYVVFDVPNHTGTYQERYNLLGECCCCSACCC